MEVQPNVLTYRGTFVDPLTEYLTLTNTSSEPLAFKVKTTAPKLYCVRPNASIIAPGESAKISVILQGYTTPLPKDFKCKDKFLIVSCPCPDFHDTTKVAENWSTLIEQYGKDGDQKKLRVNFIIEDDSRDETQVNDTTFANATQNTMMNDTLVFKSDADTTAVHDRSVNPANVSVVNPDKTLQEEHTILPVEEKRESKAFQSEIADSNKKINSLSEKLDSHESSSSETVVSPQETVSGVSLPFAAILVIIALLLGWYIF